MEPRWIYDRQGEALALFIPHQFDQPGYNFITPPELPFQVGLNRYAAGHVVPPHKHNRWARSIEQTLEFVMVRKGKVRMLVLDSQGELVNSTDLVSGDMFLFVAGGHSWEFLEDSQVLEIKQGPYVSVEVDKVRLEPARSPAEAE